MKMKKWVGCILVIAGTCINSCAKEEANSTGATSIVGTWKLVSGTTIKGRDTVVTDYTQKQEMIKIINETHFAFLRHDLEEGKDSSALFVAGGGKYTLKGNKYIEHLEYFNTREWEGSSFELEYEITGDTLTTKGVEKVEALNIDYFNIEKYHRIEKRNVGG
jgi:hypothetical protein